MNASPTPPATPPRDAGQWVALAIGLAFTLAGLAGFLITGLDGFAHDDGASLLGLEVNPLHNLAHLLFGLSGLALARTPRGAAAYGFVLAIGYGLVLLYGLVAGEGDGDVLAVDDAGNALHFGTVVAGLVVVALVGHRLRPPQARPPARPRATARR